MAETDTKTKKTAKPAVKHTARLKQLYFEKFAQELKKELKLDNIHQVPRIEKIVINVGLGKSKDDKRMFEVASNTLLKVTGQKPQETIARVSIATFKLREGNRVGMKVTLRDERMYEFLDRFINIVLPRLRDFHGVSLKSFDKQGNYSIGITEQSIFPELSFEETSVAHGMQVVIVTDSEDVEHNKELLAKFGMPFEKPKGGNEGKEK
ncbi:MAG TPA: 50S ribosomal protein L5 [Candidatus Saccharimonadales bacterium]|nr:50S ribosomal protein L5 [Candidatus Saccharimonadales bacterium]